MSNVDIVQIQNATTLAQAGQPKADSGSELGKNDFLKLLMAQLGNQDPLDPMDNDAFVQQLTSFANLEELRNMGKSFEDLINITSAGNQATMVTLLGKDVRISGSEFQGPEAKLHYTLPEAALEAQLEIRDKNGLLVRVIEDIPIVEGSHSIDVTDLPDEGLKFSIVAKNNKGEELEVKTSVSEQVTGVNFGEVIPVLITRSGREIPATEIVEIFERDRLLPGSGSDGSSPSEGNI